MTFNPSKDGNFQFSAIAHTLTHTLSEYGTFCSPNTLKYEVVEYLRNNPHNAQGFPLDVFKHNLGMSIYKKWVIVEYMKIKQDKVFKKGPSKIFGRQPLKYLNWYGLLKQIISRQIF